MSINFINFLYILTICHTLINTLVVVLDDSRNIKLILNCTSLLTHEKYSIDRPTN